MIKKNHLALALIVGFFVSCKNETGHPLPPLTDSSVLNETDLLTGTPPHEILDRIMRGPTNGLCQPKLGTSDRLSLRSVNSLMAWNSHPRGPEYTLSILNQLDIHGSELIRMKPPDMGQMCPHYSKFDEGKKKLFWASFFSILSNYESSFNPATQYQESNGVISRGLLQMSNGSVGGYGCGLAHPHHLHSPYKNFECAIKIMTRNVRRDNRIASGLGGLSRGGARYWSPLRSSHSKHGALRVRNLRACDSINRYSYVVP